MYKNLNGLHHQHRARSYYCVSFRWLNGVTQYWSRNLCGFAYYRKYYMNEIAAFFGNYQQCLYNVNNIFGNKDS
ncbi:hypothetical protein T08_593 [Trichinella sp. T8]|nr:hypothetical protein T08_593 [Trichinella sp. T8]